MASISRPSPPTSKYKISRRGRKLLMTDDQRILIALPKDVPERTWAEILQKEENDLIVLDIREEILEEAMKIGYDHYMEKQNALFTAHCAAQAWLKLIDWHFYRHDPGEDPAAYPPCFIPKRAESWAADDPPVPSPPDAWARRELPVLEEEPEVLLPPAQSASSLRMPVIEPIHTEYWFPGKVKLGDEMQGTEERVDSYYESSGSAAAVEENLAAESEVLQRVTDYSTGELTPKEESSFSALKSTPMDGSLQGAGDSVVRPKKRFTDRSKVFSRISVHGRSRAQLPALGGDSRSRISFISDCRLRNLRLDTQFEITSEKIDTPPGETIKRK